MITTLKDIAKIGEIVEFFVKSEKMFIHVTNYSITLKTEQFDTVIPIMGTEYYTVDLIAGHWIIAVHDDKKRIIDTIRIKIQPVELTVNFLKIENGIKLKLTRDYSI